MFQLKSIYNKRKSIDPDQQVNSTPAELTPVEEVRGGNNDSFSSGYQTDTHGSAAQHNDIISSCISHGDLKTFKQLFQTKQDDILSNCGTAGDGNYLLTALKRTDNVSIAEFLLSKEKLLQQLLCPTSEQKQLSYKILLTIAEFGHFKLAKKLINEGEKVNSKVTISGWAEATMSYTFEMRGVMSTHDLNCIQIAAMKGRSQIIGLLTEYLPKYMYDIQYYEGGFSPLILASRFGNFQAVKKLLKHGGVDSITYPGKLTALHFAACYNHDHVVSMLLECGANADISSGGCLGHSLVFAAALGHIEVVDTFLRWKSISSRKSKCRYSGTSFSEAASSLRAAAAGGHNDVITKLLNCRSPATDNECVQNTDVTREIHDSDSGCTRSETENSKGSGAAVYSDKESTPRAVHFADKRRRKTRRPGSPSKHTDELDIMSIDVDCLDTFGNTPLLIASYAGHVGTIELLLSRGANVRHRNSMGHGVWVMMCLPRNVDNARHQLSVYKRQPEFVKERSLRKTQRVLTGLLEVGIDIFKPDSEGLSFMHLAAQQNLHRVLKHVLPGHSVLTTTKALSGDTPLLLSMRKNNTKSVKALLKCPDSLKSADKEGKTALHLAAESNNQKAVRMIIGVIERYSVSGELNVTRPATSDRIGLDNSCDLSEVPMMQSIVGFTALHCAAGLGHLNIVKYLLRYPDCMTIVGEKGWTPLHLAASVDSCSIVRAMLELIQQLLEGDVQASGKFSRDPTSVIYQRTPLGNTPMHYAALCKRAETVEILLKYPKTLIMTGESNQTPLHIAVESENTQIVNAIVKFIQHKDNIVKFGKVVDVKDEDGDTPLHAAIKFGNVDVVKSLLQFPGTLTAQDKFGCSALMSAAMSHSNVLEIIINHLHNRDNEIIDIESEKDGDGGTLLHVAAKRSSLAATTVLLRHYPELLITTNNRQHTALHEAVGGYSEQNLETVECIVNAVRLRNNAETFECDDVEKFVMLPNESGETALHLAARKEDSDVLAFLMPLARNSWMATDKSGRTILHASQHFKTVKLIVEFMEESREIRNTQNVNTGANHANGNNLVCMRDNDGKTALHLICESMNFDEGHSSISYLLQRHPECLLVVDNQGRSPLHAAALQIFKADVVCAVLEVIKTSQPDAEYLNKNNIDIADGEYERWILRRKDSNGHTALHLAVNQGGRTDIVRKLLRDTADVTIANNYGETPLHSACTRGNIKIVQILLSAMTLESRIEIIFSQDDEGNTPLHSAVLSNRKNVVKKLLQQLRCPDCIAMKNKRGYNALHVAAENGNADILKHLLKIALDSGNKSFVNQLVVSCCEKEETPLHLAIMKEHIRCIEMLVKPRVETASLVEHDEMLPLHCAAMSSNPEVLQAFLNKGWAEGSDLFDKHGRTPLMYCIRRGDVEGFELLAGKKCQCGVEERRRLQSATLHY